MREEKEARRSVQSRARRGPVCGASVRCGFQPGSQPGLLELLDYASQHGEVHATNELRVVPGQRVEGAVAQHDSAANAVWLVPVLSQGFANGGEKPFPGLVEDQRLLGLDLRRRGSSGQWPPSGSQ
jgi:hypothetical protein